MALTPVQKHSVQRRAKPDRVTALSELETAVIGLFVQLARGLGQPHSLAEIYGLLFISPNPLALDDLIERLNLARGTVSIGLRFLNKVGAIKVVYVPRSRRVHYESVAELRKLVTRFLKDQIVPQLESSQEQMDRIADLVKRLPPDERARLNPPGHNAPELGETEQTVCADHDKNVGRLSLKPQRHNEWRPTRAGQAWVAHGARDDKSPP